MTVPTWRARDVTREVDVIEEIARPLLDRIPLTMPLRRHVQGRLTKEQRLRRVVEDALVGAGLSEAYTWSLVAADPSPDAIRLPNPMTSDQAILRTTIVPGLVEAARTGVDAGADRVALFEIARVYLPSGEQLPHERWRVGRRRRRRRTTSSRESSRRCTTRSASSFASRVRLMPCSIREGGARPRPAGSASSIPWLLEGTWGAFELDLETLFARVPERVVYEDVITYPATLQDIAVAVDEDVEVGALVDAAHEAAGELLREARVFDVYRGEQVGAGRKSVAIHLAFQSPERTLTEEEATCTLASASSRHSPSASAQSCERRQSDSAPQGSCAERESESDP